MSMLVCLLCLITLSLISVSAAPTRSPIVALLPRHLVAFYPLLADWRDYAPEGKINGYSLDGYSRSNISIAPKLGARLSQGAGLDFPVNIHAQNFPQVTFGAWMLAGQAMAVNNGCLLSQNGLNTGRAVCVERGKWAVGSQVLDEALVKIDEWSFIAVALGETSTFFFVDGKMTEIKSKVDSVASQRLVAGAAADQLLTGFTGYIRSVFVFDVALSETELSYLMTTKEVPLDTPAPPAPAHVEPVEVTTPKPYLYLKDRVGNLVSVRQVIDPDGEEYNAALPTLDDAELLSVELVYDDAIERNGNTASDPPHKGMDDVSLGDSPVVERPWIFRLSPLQVLRSVKPPIIDIFGMHFANLTSLGCSIGRFTVPAKFISSSRIQCAIEPMCFDESLSAVEIDVSVNGIDFTEEPRKLVLVNVPTIDDCSPDNGPSTGGTMVKISGHGFIENVRYSVYYGRNKSDDVEFVSSNLLIWRTTGIDSVGIVNVKLIVTEMLVPEIPNWKFVFTQIPEISTVFPQLLPVRSETTLTISGSGFGDFATLLCSFINFSADGKALDGESWTSLATFVASSIVQCQTPAFTDADAYTVSVSNNAQDFSSTSDASRFTVHKDIILEKASAMAGPAIGGTSVDITGQHFVRSTDAACRFGETRARAYFVSDAVVRCISPAWTPTVVTEAISSVAVQIALNGLDFCTSSVSFQYYSPPIIDRILPANAPVNSSLSLTLVGKYLIAYGGVVCRIGATLQVPGIVKSGGRMVQCDVVETTASSGLLEISVSLNGGRDFTRSQTSLLVHEPIAIRSVDAPYVAKNSNTSVSIRGHGFTRTGDVKCVFGEILTNATIISPELLTCSLPPSVGPDRDYKLRVSLNNGLHVSSAFALVRVYDVPTFEDITPVDGNSVLKVTGTGFVINDSFSLALGCVLGDYAQVVARVENDSSLECIVPDCRVVGNATTVSVNFQIGASIIHTDLTYTYEPTPLFVAKDPGQVPGKMTHVFPDISDGRLNSSSPASGNKSIPVLPLAPVDIYDISPKFVVRNSRVNITVRGQNFQRNTTFCHFGSQSEPVPAIVKSHALVLCEFDGSVVEPGPISLAISLSSLRPSVSTTAFALVAAPTITSVYPRRGPLEGDTNVLITGTGFIGNTALYCDFAGYSKILATRLTDTMVHCKTPPSQRGHTSELRLSVNSSIFSSNSIDFLYQDTPELVAVSPSYGSVGGGATVYLHGRYLNASEDSIDCTFGSSRVLDAVIVNSTSVIVKSPPSTTGAGDVSVKCTSGGEVLTSAELSYHYLLTPYTSRATPQMGLATSHTTVVVDGTGFSDKYPMTCNFGEVSSSATVKSRSQVECVAPPQSPSIVNVSVVFGDSPVGNPSVAFEYIAEPVLQQVIPPLGSETGSTRLLVIGEQFARNADFSCAFSRENDLPPVTTTAFWVSEQSVVCVTPPYSPGLTVLQLAMSNTLSSSSLLFNFTIEPRVLSIVPQYSSGGGNIIVMVNGVGFIDSDLARCSLGTIIVHPVRVESDSLILCEFPRQFHSGVFPVRVTVNNQDFTADTVLFALYPPVVVDYATPVYGLLDEEQARVGLVGHNFHKLVDLICQLHVDDTIHTVAAIYASPSLSTCFVSAPTKLYSINTSVSVSAQLLVKEAAHEEAIFAAPFLYLARPIPLTVFPNVLLSTGGQTIYFDGVNFSPAVDMMCQFESYFPYDQAPLEVINSTYGFCVTSERAPGPVEVRICFKDQDRCSYDSLALSYVRVPVVHTLMPSARLKAGNPTVTVVGNGFYNVPMQCQFDGLRTPATFVNQSTVVCPDSPVQDRCKSFSLYVDGIDILEQPLEFCTRMAPMVNMIRPTTGPDTGGTRVLVSGGPFIVNGGYSCHFGEIHAPAAYLSSTQIFCISPPSRSRTVNFSVSGNNFSEIDMPRLEFTYRPAPVAIAVSPSRGSQDGQYHVTIQGLNFVLSAGLRCRFGDSHIVAGKWLSDTSIACEVPPHSPGWVDIQVTNNLQDYSVETLRFEYVVSPTVLDFEPTTMYAQNPKELTIFGRDFQNSTNLRCIIGNDFTIATFVSDTQIQCAPANLVETSVVVGAIDLELSMIGSLVSNRLKVLDDGVWSLRPRVTSVRGETPIVLSRSENDEPLDFEVYYGRFCSQSGRVCSDLSPTDLKEPNKFNWFPPKWTGPDLMGVIEFFRVTNTSLTPSTPVTTFPFRYYREVELSKLTPPIGSIAGGTTVTLLGANFQDSLNLSCVLNGATFTPAHFITDTMISCTIPPFGSGPREIGVFVSLNGLEVSETSLSFKYEEDPSVFSIFPVGGPVAGSTIVSVKGANFLSTSRSVCSFGQHMVSAIVLSSSEVTCTIHPSSLNLEGSVLFRFSANGQEFSKEKVSYLFYEDPSMIELSPRIGSTNGGTTITVSLPQVVPSEILEHLTCEIGSLVATCNVISGMSVGLTVPQPPGGLKGPVKTRLSLNGQNYVEGSPFWYLEEPTIYSIYPNSSGETSRTWIRVAGANFPRVTTLSCQFGLNISEGMTPAEWVSERMVLCRAPVHRPGTLDFGFSMNGVDLITTNIKFTFTPKTIPRDFYPMSGSTVGGSELMIPVDIEMYQCGRLNCLFGDVKVIASVDKPGSTLKCTIPPQHIDPMVSIAVECDERLILEFNKKFQYYSGPKIMDIEPQSMSIQSGGMIGVRGRNFPENASRYQFDANSVTVVETLSESGKLPPISSVGPVAVSASNNDSSPFVKSISPRTDVFGGESMLVSGHEFIPDILHEKTIDPIQVVIMIPDSGPVRGGSVVVLEIDRVLDSGDNLVCHFGDNPVHAIETKLGTIICRSPPAAAPGQVLVGVTLQDHSPMSNGTHKFTYLLDEIITSFSPETVMGSQTNVNLTISGLNFYHNDIMATPLCRIGKAVSRASIVSSTRIVCPPPQLPDGQYSVSVACDGVNFVSSVSTITYIAPVWISAIQPSVVAASGGMILEVKGTGFAQEIAIECNFGRGEFITAADVISSSFVLCGTPSVGNHSRTLSLSVSTNTSASNEVLLSFVAPITLISATPNVGFSRGGTIVKVDATQVPPSGDLRCFFGDVQVSAQRLTPYQIGCKSPPSRPEQVKLTVEGEGVNTIGGSSLLFTFLPDLEVESVSPTRGSPTGGTEVNLTLSGAIDASIQEKIMCHFGAIFVDAQMIKKNQVTCISPLGSQNEDVVLAIALDGDDVAVSPVRFQYFASRELLSIEPRVGSLDGNLTMLAVLENIEVGSGIAYDCSFEAPGDDIIFSKAQLSLSGEILCRVPNFKYPHRILVSIWQNGERYSSNSLTFEAILAPTIASVSPTTLTELEGIRIRVVGTNVSPYQNFKCIFGDAMITEAEVISRAQLECVSPQLPPGNHSFGISWNTQETVRSKTSLNVVETLALKAIEPKAGFRDQQPEIRVVGSGFYPSSSLVCRFGNMRTPAAYINRTEVRCQLPLLPSLPVQLSQNLERHVVLVELSLDGKTFVSSVKVAFTYYSTPRIDSIYPSSGSILGHTRLLIRGGLDENLQYNCLVGGIAVPAVLLNSSTLSCFTPAVETPARVQVSVGVLGVSISSEFPLWFTYYDPPMILSVSPNTLKTTGGEMIVLSGKNFIPASAIQCLFSDSIPSPATFISSSSISCIAPPRRNAGYVSLEITINGVDYTESHQSVYYFDYVDVLSSSPLEGEQQSLKDEKMMLFCSFEDQDSPALANNESPACISPGAEQGSVVPVGLDRKVLNLDDTFDAKEQANYEFYDAVFPKLTEITPSSGSAAEGTVVTLSGSGFLEGMVVRFGLGSNARSIPASVVSASIATAEIPELVEGVVSVAVSMNEVDFSESLTFYVRTRPVLHSVYPSTVSLTTSMETISLQISGIGFSDTAKETMSCRIGDDGAPTAVDWVSSTQIRCPASHLEAGIYSVYVALNGVNFVNDGVKIVYQEHFIVYSISPAIGGLGGNTKVQVLGSNFVGNTNETDLVCVFGTKVSSLQIINASLAECLSPSQRKSGDVTFTVTRLADVLLFKAAGLRFYYHKMPTITRVLPSMIRATTTSALRIIGSNFLDSLSLSCFIQDILVPARFVSSTIVECLLYEKPNGTWLPGAVLSVEVSNNGQDVSNSEAQILVQALIQLIRLEPSQGPVRRRTSVKILAEYISAEYENLKCHVGETQVVLATNLGNGWTECVLPASSRAGTVQISLSVDGVYYSEESLRFAYEDVSVVYSIYPTSGPFRGGTMVDVHGEGFDVSSGVYCGFGSSMVEARVKSPLAVVCVSPPYISGTDQAVSVTVVKADPLGIVPAVDSLDSVVFFSYAALPQVVEVTPSAVVTGGRPLITLQTTGIHSAAIAWCKFGRVVVKAGPINPAVGTVSCRAPELQMGRYLVEVSANERDFSESRMGYFVSDRRERRKLNPEYENVADESTITIDDPVEPEENSVSPVEESITVGVGQILDLTTINVVSASPLRGPIGGGTPVVLKLSSTYPSSLVFCQFGTAVVCGTVQATEVECIAPPVATANTVELRIGANELDFEVFGAEFEYLADISHLLRLTPLNGVLSGGTLLHIFGIPFDEDDRYSCKIGGQIVKAEYTNKTHVGCRTPAVSKSKQVVVKISNNDVDYSEFNLAFAYVDPLFVSRIYPFSGDIGGGQFVNVIGGNFTAGAESLQCRFGNTVVPASVLSPSTVQCIAPKITGIGISGLKVAVEVTSNGQDYSTSGVVYHYTPTPDVLSLEPNHGPLQGGTEVVVTGINFLNSSSLRCKFGEHVTAAAAFLDSKHFTCVSPSGFKEGDIYVEIANHGLFGKTLASSMFTNSKKVFTYDSELEIHSVFPSLGPTTGNFSVRITGGKFRKTDAVRCKFSEIVVVATWISYDEILCMAPPHSPGVFTLGVTRNAQDYTDTLVPFTYYAEQGIRSISPTFGPAFAAGTRIDIDGVAFVDSSLLSCRFGYVVTPGEYVSPTKMRCTTPPLPILSGGLIPAPLPEYRNQFSDPNVGSVYLFPDAHYYPHYLTRLVSVEVSNNQQDFSLTGINFLYYRDETLVSIAPTEAFDSDEPLAIFAYGRNFINTTALTCRLGLQTFPATFVTSQLLLCEVAHPMIYDNARRGSGEFYELAQPRHALFEISNNGRDFTTSHVVFEFLGACPTGFFCPKQLQGSNGKLSCPRGTYCPGVGNTVFTLCPRGTYQPKTTQAACLRCPIGYHCPHTGMHVPRLCPAGFVCDVTGIEEAEQPCPEGHYCLEGTATTATTCTPTSSYTGMLIASPSAGERPTTLRRQRQKSSLTSVQARKSGCWRNETEDFGLQLSSHPSRFWMELRQLPLSPGSSFKATRGRFCLDDSCMKLADADNLRVEDVYFDYDSTDFALRRPVACPAGSYCHPGTAASDSLMKNFSTAQPCFEAMYCPEGSSSPRGFGECAPGFYCPFGTRIPCPAGSYCPQTGHISPLPCPPGTLNGMTAQSKCTSCPVGFICPGYGRIMPALCPAGYVCSKTGLASPNSLCPRGFYCLEGTATSDGFRNDTRVRPYPCKPGTYCLKGVVADEVRFGDYRYPQNCTAGFYCELGSYSPKGSGLCPPGFTCPSGTAAPIPTAKGTFAQLEGSVSAAECAPGYYAPTIESTECVPCPPGTTCENDGTAVATICPPGSYRGSLAADGLACLACPQGTWSKNWELRGVEECVECAPGTVCPIDGISNPCTVDDLPFVYTPLSVNLTFAQCLERGSNYYFGVLLEPWIDELGRGAHFLPDRDNGRCYENTQPRGTDLYQRFADFHGPLYDIATGTGVPHQGYGDDGQYPPPNMFARGSLAIDLPVSRAYDVSRNCTPGFFYKKQWYPGTCEADIFCSASVWSKVTSAEELVGQAQPCPEGYVCDASTTAATAFSHLCPAGYVCGAGTTPDLTLDSPRGQLRELCPAGKYCVAGTAESQKERYVCPAGYFCPTGTANPLTGEIANDALRRRLSSEQSNPFLYVNYTKYVGEGDIRPVSAHDMRCFDGIDEDLIGIFKLRPDPKNAGKKIVVNRAEEQNHLCARDHKWRTVELALRRNECDCVAQTKVVRRVFQLWKCTTRPKIAQPVVFDPTRFGWADVHNSAIQCVFPGSHGSKPVDLTELIANTSTGVRFQTGWTETTSVHSYTELWTLVETKYAVDVFPMDPYVYDLHHAIELIDSYGEEVPSIAGFVSGSSEEGDEDLIRLDACACSQMFKCPNGTTSTTGADSIYHCVKTGDEVLQRISPIPLTSDRLLNGTVFQDLTGTSGHGLGSILLEPFEVAVVTINATQLARNLTYDAHYQISVYQDCKPCPPQYKCDLSDEPPSCTYPDNDITTATRLYEKCLENYDSDIFVCNNMPFFCDRRTLPLAEVSRDAFYSGSNETVDIAGCCSCERQELPYFFENAASTDRGFPDNKHGHLQFSVSALAKMEITIAVELVHGLYVREFGEGFTEDKFDLTVFTPGRADYSPSTPSTNTFLAVMQQADMDELMLPLNLPEEYVRVAGSLSYKQQVASTVLINRMSDIFVGDPELPLKRGFVRNSEQNSIGELVSVDANSSSNGSTDTDAVVVSPTDYFGLYSVPDRLEVMLRSDSWWAQELAGTEFLALPYLPYFSSCRGFDSNIFIFKMLETHPDCTFVSYDQTVEVDQYPWRKKLTPNADRCLIQYTAEVTASSSLISSISSEVSTLTTSSDSSASTSTFATFQRGVSLSCLYEENLEGGAEKPRWYETPAGTTLFYITRDPTAADAFVAEGDVATGTGWGRSDTIQNTLGTDALIPVKVGSSAGLPLAVPQEVYLNLSYYQVTPGQKRLVEAYVNFGKLCAVTRSAELLATLAKKGVYPCAISKATNQLASKAYTLQVSWEPLNWFELMNLFQFTVDVYLGFFTLVAMASMILGFVIWVINRLFTKMKRPPKFRMKLLLKNVATPPPTGIFMASIPIFLACVLIYIWWHILASTDPLNNPSAASFEATAGDWLDQISLDKTRVQNYKRGRVGLSLVIIGIYLLLLGSKLLVPETLNAKPEDNAFKEMSIVTPSDPFAVEADKEEEEENEFWDPRAWKRANFLLTTLCFMGSMLVFWEFSYSPAFTGNIYGYLVLFKIMRAVVEFVLESFLHEKLLVMPFAVVLSVSESMMAMGSADFIGFTLFYFVNLTLVMIEHLYTAPLVRRMRSLWPKWRLSLQRKMKKRRRRTREQKALEEAEWQRVCERIDNQASGVEAVLEGVAGYSVVFTELFIAPILLAFQAFFSDYTRIPALYGVRQTDLLYYALFSVFIIPSNFVLGALQLNTMELAHGWKLYEYSAYQRHRFATRDTRWPLAYTEADESIHPSCQSLDLLCFSSQLYFLLIVYSAGILLGMLGMSVCLRASYSFFGDPITLLIIGVVYYLMRALEISCIKLGDKFKVWKPRKLADGTLDEDLAAKLALGAGRQRELERERLELQALNSERFRHRFLERNRPWVLQHLAELFTPRTLQATDGPAGDGRPNSEYIRDLYHELVNMGEGRRLKDDRSDISSDSEDELEKMRRSWSNVPVEGASRDLALYWLARARKRRTFAKLIAGIVAANRQSECCVCGKTEDGGYTLHVDLAAEEGAKEQDPRALDRLIDGFESELGEQEMDSDLWKAYFRKHAAFATLCNVCLTSRQQALGNRTKKLVEGMRKLRADEFSSDEGSDEDGGDVPFAPIVVARGAIEGRVLTKWLLAARKRLGGTFPRPEAQEEMERYARKLKRSRRRAGKTDHVDSDEEGKDPSRHWRLELNEAARALALRWVWEARDLRDAAARNAAAELREKLQTLNDQIVEADDWFFGRELREAGLALRDDGAHLAEEQARVDEDLAQKIRATERDVETFVEEKRATTAAEEKTFAELIAKEREDAKVRAEARELEQLEAYKQKETEFAAAQRQAREAGELVPALVAEHRTYLAKMAEDRRTELESMEEAAHNKAQQKEDAFARKLALAEAAAASRRALAQHRVLALQKEARGVVRARESAWQSKVRSWIDRASRKVQVKQQEDAEAQLNDKRRRKRVLLAT